MEIAENHLEQRFSYRVYGEYLTDKNPAIYDNKPCQSPTDSIRILAWELFPGFFLPLISAHSEIPTLDMDDLL